MSKQEEGKNISANQGEQTPPERSIKRTAEPAKTVKVAKPVKRRGFFATVFSHLAVATIAVIGVGSYLHWDDILTYSGSRVCAYDVLGKYAKSTPKVPPIDAQAAPKKVPKGPEVKVGDDTTSAPKPVVETPKPKPPSFKNALQAARKQFWENDKAAVAAYEALVVSKPNNADLRAEMANVYYKNDLKQKAVQAFFEAGKLHAEQKNTKKGNAILEVLNKLAPEKSVELSKLMNTATN